IGLGGGGTLDILASKQLKKIYAVELEKEVVRASRIMFGTRDHPLDRENVDLLVDDGRNALLRMAKSNPASLDLIVSQPSHPWLSGASNLYTVEHFKIVSDNLKPGGIFCQWVNLFRMNEKGFRSLMKAFSTSFEHGYIFQVDDSSVFLLGSNRKFKLDGKIIKQHLKEKPYQEYQKDYGVDLNKIMDAYLLDYEGISQIGKKGQMNSDRTPVIETVLPWVYHNTTFNLYSFFEKENISSGLKPAIIVNISSGELESFFKDKLAKIDFLGKEKRELERQISDFKATIRGWENFPGFEFNKIKSLYYEKIKDYSGAVKQLLSADSIVKSNFSTLARMEWANGDYFQALFTNIILVLQGETDFLAATAGILMNEILQTELFIIDFRPESDELKAHLALAERLERIFGSKRVFSFYGKLFEQLKQKTKINDKNFWKVIAWSELQKPEPEQKYLQKYMDYGGSEHGLLKEILIFYSRAGNREIIDELIDILKITEENIVEKWLIGRKLEALQLYSAAEGILEEVERKNRGKDEVEKFKLYQKLAEIKIRLGKLKQAQSYIDLMKEIKVNSEDAKIIKETKKLLIDSRTN
ncbi:MAG: spermidine synthase, partial [Myxococcota bacterium]